MNRKHQKKSIGTSVFDDYAGMRETLNQKIPEILKSTRYKELIDFWADDEIPMYCYYEMLEYLFIDLLTGEENDDELLERVLDFMEDMANSKDEAVETLLQVQILEGLFGLDYDTFAKMERRLFRPRTLALFQKVKEYFRSPEPPSKKF